MATIIRAIDNTKEQTRTGTSSTLSDARGGFVKLGEENENHGPGKCNKLNDDGDLCGSEESVIHHT
jgi:hypothetical protein